MNTPAPKQTNTLTQCQTLKKALERGERLTGLEIIQRYRILGYSQRMGDLIRKGLPIVKEWVTTTGGARVIQYSLDKGGNA